ADRHEDAVAAAQRAIQMLPNEHMGYTNLCRAYNDLKQFNKAIEACNNALKIKQNDGETFFYLARAHDFLGNREQADSFYKKAVLGLVEFTKNNPAYSDGFYLLGNAYLAVNERSKAIEAYKNSLEIAPNFAKARYNLGYAYLISGNKQLAREQYEALLNIDQNLAARLLEVINKR
ncbi:MAG: tetratricopeptide repeat protein, partial [Acidobacteria bacterium]